MRWNPKKPHVSIWWNLTNVSKFSSCGEQILVHIFHGNQLSSSWLTGVWTKWTDAAIPVAMLVVQHSFLNEWGVILFLFYSIYFNFNHFGKNFIHPGGPQSVHTRITSQNTVMGLNGAPPCQGECLPHYIFKQPVEQLESDNILGWTARHITHYR